MKSLKQDSKYKNEYNIFSTVIYTTGDLYKYMDEVYVTTIRKFGKVGSVEKIGVWKDGGIDYIKK